MSLIGMIKNTVFIGANLLEHLQLPLCIFIALLVTYFLCGKRISIKVGLEQHAVLIIYFVSMLAAAFSMILSTQFPERAWSIVVVFAAVVAIHSFESFSLDIPKIMKVRLVIAVMLVILSAGSFVNCIVRLKSIAVFHQQRIELIETAIQDGEKSAEISAIASTSPYSVFGPIGDLNWDSTTWPNTAMARYYGVEEIIRASEDFDY